MEQLSKQQLILVALLVSFVTSLATGIFTVSLMSQAPQGVVQTINQVVEKMVTPQNATVNDSAIGGENIANAVENVTKSIVKLHAVGAGDTTGQGGSREKVLGLGLIVSKDGIVITDKSVLGGQSSVDIEFANEQHRTMSIIQSQINGDVVFLIPLKSASTNSATATTFTPITFARVPKLGQTILTLSGTQIGTQSDSFKLAQGIISQLLIDNINPDGSQPAIIGTTINVADPSSSSAGVSSENLLGSPLFNTNGEVIGMNTRTVSRSAETRAFYPVMQLKGAIPKRQ